MNQLNLIRPNSTTEARAIPFEFELRVVGKHLELWRWVGIWGQRDRLRFKRIERRSLRKGGTKFPAKRGAFRKWVYRSARAKAKALWRADGCPSAWICRFNAFALVESGIPAPQEERCGC